MLTKRVETLKLCRNNDETRGPSLSLSWKHIMPHTHCSIKTIQFTPSFTLKVICGLAAFPTSRPAPPILHMSWHTQIASALFFTFCASAFANRQLFTCDNNHYALCSPAHFSPHGLDRIGVQYAQDMKIYNHFLSFPGSLIGRMHPHNERGFISWTQTYLSSSM